jgi:threonyl-tRNA synthetase
MFKAQPAGDEIDDNDRVYAIKPMNCPGHILIFKHGLKSYRDLPLRMAEFGIVHRYEPSGALHGLMRVRGFTQDDAHIFCTEEQIAEECLKINDLILSTYADFGFSEFVVKLSTRPEKRVGTDAAWDHAEDVMMNVLKQIEEQSGGKIRTGINPGEGAFYGPKFEYVLRDAIGRDWQCGTTQIDLNLPGRFGAFYVDRDGEKKTPVMIHRAICGSMERFLGVLLEHFAGHLPLWLAPVQVVVASEVGASRAGPPRGNRSSQREDQLQGPRALAAEGARDPGLRKARDGGGDGQYPKTRSARPGFPAAGRCRRRSQSRGYAAGSETRVTGQVAGR